MEKIKKSLIDDRLRVRLSTLWLIGLLLNLFGWTVGYNLLPEQLFQGIFPGGEFVSTTSGVVDTLISIIIYNIIIAGGIIIAANLFRIRWFPLGYLVICIHWMSYGLFLGTNSFDIDQGAKIAPSLVHLLSSAGFFEISGFTFIAAATINLYMFKQETFLQLSAKKTRRWNLKRLKRNEIVSLVLGIGLIFLGAYKESLSILFG